MKTITLFFTILLSQFPVSGDALRPIFRPRIGIGRMDVDSRGLGFLQIGLMLTPSNAAVFLALDDDLHFSSRKETWPGQGDYRFRTTFNNLGFSLGVNFLRSHKMNFQLGLKLHQAETWGRLLGGNDWIRSNVSNSYYNYRIGLSPVMNIYYQVNHKISLYFNCQSIRTHETSFLVGLGAAYTIVSRYEND